MKWEEGDKVLVPGVVVGVDDDDPEKRILVDCEDDGSQVLVHANDLRRNDDIVPELIAACRGLLEAAEKGERSFWHATHRALAAIGKAEGSVKRIGAG